MKKVIVVGGGAAGFFTAIAIAETHPDYKVTILEKSSQLLQKVKISGGGRCNVTHSCFEAKQLIKNYPRGERELLGSFTRFNPTHTIDWFAQRGVTLKTEEDGRMFPVTDSSQTVIDCFLKETAKLGIDIKTLIGVDDLVPPTTTTAKWQVITNKDFTIEADTVVITTGSATRMWGILGSLGHTIVPAVPSLFTFNINDKRIKGLEGLSVEAAGISVVGTRLSSNGPLLITHWGMSGPCILRLSAWGARAFADMKYNFEVDVNWTGQNINMVRETLKSYKQNHPKKTVLANPLFSIPKRLWESLISNSSSTPNQNASNYADLSNKRIDEITTALAACRFKVTGKSTFKDEFVTAGGIDLDEVDLKTMQSKKHNGLYFAGEVLNIDAITGGFNFQAAWTTGFTARTLA